MARPQSAGAFYLSALTVMGLGFVGAIILSGFLFNEVGKAKQDRDKAVTDLKTHFDTGDRNHPFYSRSDKHAEGHATTIARLCEEIKRLDAQLESLNKADVPALRNENEQAAANMRILQRKYDELVATSEGDRKADAARVEAAQKRATDVETMLAAAKDDAARQATEADQRLKDLTATVDQIVAEWTKKVEESEKGKAEAQRLAGEFKSKSEELRRVIEIGKIPQLNDVAAIDATVAQLLPNNEISFNIGKNQGVRPGMTFEVFDRGRVVRVETGNQVAGKATYEVYRTDDTSCVARLVRINNGARVVAGDSLINIAFDASRQLTFMVWGKFDLENVKDPRREIEDQDRVKALINAMGAKVADMGFTGQGEEEHVVLDPNVDYVVVGASVDYPAELSVVEKLDPVKVEAHREAMRQYKIYQDLIDQAKRMQIPVCNQNRFVELAGFYTR